MGGHPPFDTVSGVFSALAGLLAGITGGMGLGGGTVLMIYLNFFTKNRQLTAQGINLLFFVPVGITAVIIYAVKRKIRLKTLLLMLPGGVGGSLLGSHLLGLINEDILRTAFALLLIIIGIKELFAKNGLKKDKKPAILSLANICSIFKKKEKAPDNGV